MKSAKANLLSSLIFKIRGVMEMKKYIGKNPIRLNEGHVALSEDQIRRRANFVKCIVKPKGSEKEGNYVKGIYKILSTIVFKAGELFETDVKFNPAQMMNINDLQAEIGTNDNPKKNGQKTKAV